MQHSNKQVEDDHGMVGPRPSIKKLCMAAREGNLDDLKKQLGHLSATKSAKYINKLDRDHHSPLHYAARYNQSHVVDYLIDIGADIDIEDDERATPFHYAARYHPLTTEQPVNVSTMREGEDVPDGDKPDSQSSSRDPQEVQDYILKRFIKKGRKETGSSVNSKDKHGMTALHLAAMKGNTSAIETLLGSEGIDVMETDKQDMTPLHIAAVHSQADAARLLIDNGAPIYQKGGVLGSTPLHQACTVGNLEIARKLFEVDRKSDNKIVHERDNTASTPLHRAAEGGHAELAKECINNGAKIDATERDGTAPLHLAAKSGNKDVVNALLDKGADVDAANDKNETPLHKAASRGLSEICEILAKRSKTILNSRNRDQLTPLLKAAHKGHVKTVEVLLKNHADVGVTDKSGKSVIYLAAAEDHLNTLKCLLSDIRVITTGMVNASNYYGNTPLHVAAERGYARTVKYLLQRGAKSAMMNEREQTPLHLASMNGQTKVMEVLLSRDKSLLNAEEEQACTPLHLAAENGQIRAVELLIQEGADTDILNHDRRTALHLAAAGGSERTVNTLLMSGCQVDTQDMKNRTPLHLAASNGNKSVVKLLLHHNADVGLTEKTGRNCLDLAVDKGHKNVALAIIHSSKWNDALKNAHAVPNHLRHGIKDPHLYDKYNMVPNGNSEDGPRLPNRTGKWNNNQYYDTPMRKLIRSMPDVAEEVFTRCCDSKGGKSTDPEYKIEYNYEFLDDAYLLRGWVKEDLDDCVSSTDATVAPYDSKKNLRPGAHPYTNNINILSENHPLHIMVSSKRQDLLSHPLVTALLRLKWKTGRIIYYANLSNYLLFLFFLTGYVVDDGGRDIYQYLDSSKLASFNGTECERIVQYMAATGSQYHQSLFSVVCKYGSIVFALIIAVREIVELTQKGFIYLLSFINVIEWAIIITTLLLCLDFDYPCQSETGIRQAWQWQLSGIAIFWAWMDLVLFMRKIPLIGIYSVMFTDVIKTFMRFSPVLFLLCTAFGLSFHTLVGNQFPFRTMLSSLVKTFTMMTGDLDYTVVAHDPYTSDLHIQSWFNVASTGQFILFIVIMIIIVMNLLIGLAVDDIKMVQEQAALKRKAMQVELILGFEGLLLKLRHSNYFCSRFQKLKSSKISETLKMNGPRKWYQRFVLKEPISPARIAKVLDIDSVVTEQDKMTEQVENIESRVKGLEAMMQALLEHHNIQFDPTTQGLPSDTNKVARSQSKDTKSS